MCYLNLHLEVCLEVGKQSEEDGEGELEDFGHRGHPVLGQSHTQVLLDGVDEHLVCLENWTSILQDGEEQLEGQDLRPQLVGPDARRRREERECFMFRKEMVLHSFERGREARKVSLSTNVFLSEGQFLHLHTYSCSVDQLSE